MPVQHAVQHAGRDAADAVEDGVAPERDPLATLEEKAGRRSLYSRYEPVRTLGRGAFGRAVLCRRLVDNEPVVVKEINVGSLDEKGRRDARNEVEMMRRLDHPNVVRYVESVVEGQELRIVMEYACGGDLHARIGRARAAGRHFSEGVILAWFVQIVLALKHCHQNRLLHRDLKTQNILLANKDNISINEVRNRERDSGRRKPRKPGSKNVGVVKLADFGVSRVLLSDSAMAHSCVGTPYYLSPELCQDQPYGYASDIWSLGCVLYELVSLRHAFDGCSLPALVLRILDGKYQTPDPENRYSPEITKLIGRMLQMRPEDRPTAQQILEDPLLRPVLEEYYGEIQKVLALPGGIVLC